MRQPGGASRDRTGDLKLAKLALSQLSYGPEGAYLHYHRAYRTLTVLQGGWWAWEDSNFRPHPYQGCALTD